MSKIEFTFTKAFEYPLDAESIQQFPTGLTTEVRLAIAIAAIEAGAGAPTDPDFAMDGMAADADEPAEDADDLGDVDDAEPSAAIEAGAGVRKRGRKAAVEPSDPPVE